MKRTSRWSAPVTRVAGIEIRVHLTFVFLVALFAVPYKGGPSVPENLAFLAIIAACIVAHELAHSVVARRRGATVQEIVLLPIGGVSKLEHLPESPNDEFAIAIVSSAGSSTSARRPRRPRPSSISGSRAAGSATRCSSTRSSSTRRARSRTSRGSFGVRRSGGSP